jgi:hypothetical protein
MGCLIRRPQYQTRRGMSRFHKTWRKNLPICQNPELQVSAADHSIHRTMGCRLGHIEPHCSMICVNGRQYDYSRSLKDFFITEQHTAYTYFQLGLVGSFDQDKALVATIGIPRAVVQVDTSILEAEIKSGSVGNCIAIQYFGVQLLPNPVTIRATPTFYFTDRGIICHHIQRYEISGI